MGVEISKLSSDPQKSVNGVWRDLPGFPGVRVRVAQFRFSDFIEFRADCGIENDDDAERAYYGGRVIRDVEGLEENGDPIEWTEQTGMRLMSAFDTVTDERTGKEHKVYRLDALYHFVRLCAQQDNLYASDVAGN